MGGSCDEIKSKVTARTGQVFLRSRFWRYAPCLADRPRYGVGLMLVSRLKFHE